jgi:release factor glutamine methyltransferase
MTAQINTPSIAVLLDYGRQKLGAALGNDPHADPALDSEILLAHYAHLSRTDLHAKPEFEVDHLKAFHFCTAIEQRAIGTPVAYLLNTAGFHALELFITPDVLIPRPETELLVDWALEIAREDATILDLGTGSGAIALSLANALPNAQIVATDQSMNVLDVAERNAEQYGYNGRVRFLEGSWYEALEQDPALTTFDLIVSNPPYVAENDPHLEQGDVMHEPKVALVSGPDGLNALRVIIAGAPQRLNTEGWLLVEHGYDQEAAVQDLFQQANFTNVTTRKDLNGHPRITGGQGPRTT